MCQPMISAASRAPGGSRRPGAHARPPCEHGTYAVEPLANIAVLGGPDGPVLYDDANAFEEFVAATEANN